MHSSKLGVSIGHMQTCTQLAGCLAQWAQPLDVLFLLSSKRPSAYSRQLWVKIALELDHVVESHMCQANCRLWEYTCVSL